MSATEKNQIQWRTIEIRHVIATLTSRHEYQERMKYERARGWSRKDWKRTREKRERERERTTGIYTTATRRSGERTIEALNFSHFRSDSRRSLETWPCNEVHVVHARGSTNGMVFTNANKHSYQLQNDSAAAGIGRPVFNSPRRPIRALYRTSTAVVSALYPLTLPLPSAPFTYQPLLLPEPTGFSSPSRHRAGFYTSTTNFWSPAFPCNLENDRAEPRASQIFDTRKPGKKRTRSGQTERMTNSRPPSV